MARIRIERVPVGVAGLGLLGFDHLQIVYQPDEFNPLSSQDSWYVLEGLRVSGIGYAPILGVEGINGHTTLSEANNDLTGLALTAAIGTPAMRGSRILNFADPVGAWSLMASYGREIALQLLPYYPTSFDASPIPTINSNSVIASLLYYAGVDIADAWPRGTRFTPGWTTLIGTRAGDHMTMDGSFNTLVAGEGNDTLEGSSDSRTDKMYGGLGDDMFKWSSGINYIHGGQPQMPYEEDGLDTVNYAGVGSVLISGDADAVPHKTPNYTARFSQGTDYLFSIERIVWDVASDQVEIGEGASIFDEGLILDLGQQSGTGHGDSTDFSRRSDALIFNATGNGDEMVVLTALPREGEKGLWLESPEWIVGSAGDDRVFTTSTLRGVEGAAGDDLIDAHTIAAFTAQGPDGFDVAIDGGDGDDTLVANAGHSLVHGGAGADRFILPELSGAAGKVIMTIADADADDRLFMPIALFDGSGGGLDGSELMPLLGGVGTWEEMTGFGFPSVFEWRLESQVLLGSNLTQGLFTFIGDISYSLNGADLVIQILGGTPMQTVEGGRTLTIASLDLASEADIIIKDFTPGDLGLIFWDLGTPTQISTPYGSALHYPNWDAATLALTNGGVLDAPLDAAPAPPSVRPDIEAQQLAAAAPVSGGAGNDVLTLTVATHAFGNDGNDSIAGSSGGDIIDGGSGADTMTGGAGNDIYTVDQSGDVVSEAAANGRETVIAFADYSLGANIEDLTLAGTASSGTGNALANTLLGNDGANSLSGLDGADIIAGGGDNDLVMGGAGGDIYSYTLGDGADTIIDAAAMGDTDTLALSSIAANDVRVWRRAATPDDLVLGFADGGSVTLKDFILGGGTSVETVAFDTGAGWTRNDLEALAATAPMLTAAPPTAVADPTLATALTSITLAATTLTANDVSPDGLPLAIVSVQGLSGGTVQLAGDGSVIVTAPAGGGDTVFAYTISDGQGGLSTATVTLAFVANAAPIATQTIADQTVMVAAPLTYTLPTTLFADADGDPMTLSATLAGGAPLPGWLTFNAATGTFSGTPPTGAQGALDIVVSATDGLAAGTAAFRITVATANRPPVAITDSFTMYSGGTITITSAALIGNDNDPDGDALQVVAAASTGGHGSVVLQTNGSILYTPNAGFVGQDSFSYTVSDGHGGLATVVDTVDVIVQGVTLTGTSSADTLAGGGGDDTITGGAGNDVMTGNGGNDLFLISGTGAGNDFFSGGAGSDTIRGSAGADIIGLQAVAGNLAGIEMIDGGAGSDTIRGTSGSEFIDLSAITLVGIELISGFGGNDTIRGSAGADTIAGSTGNDVLSGNDGNDLFLLQTGANGFDAFDGGAGFDRILGTAGNDVLGLAGGAAGLAGIESIDLGGGADTIKGSTGADTIDLSAIVLAGVELIDGGAGNDTIIGSAGNDILRGGADNNRFVLRAGGGQDTIGDFKIGTTAAPLVDIIDVSAFGFGSFATLATNFSASGSDTLITLDASTSIKLTGVTPGQLKADDFVV